MGSGELTKRRGRGRQRPETLTGPAVFTIARGGTRVIPS
jgi:hypothetical protein